MMATVGNSHALIIVTLLHHTVFCQMDDQKYKHLCHQLTADPFFDVDYVTEKPWRVYYTWKIKMGGGKCLDMTFDNSTPQVLQRYLTEMADYLQHQPNWDSASLLLTIGEASHEMLLLFDQGAAGAFVGVPNIIRNTKLTPAKNTVPLLKFHMKLFNDGKYLVIMDCQLGVTTLSARSSAALNREEMLTIARNLNLEDGEEACLNKGEYY